MKFLVYSAVGANNIAASMGMPEYSYYFVLKDFLPVLQSLGDVQFVTEPQVEVDALYDEALAHGRECIFLSFSPPHKTFVALRCPTVPVFAWEFSSIPNEHWLDDINQNWVHVLKQCRRAITHSTMVVQAVRNELGAQYPILSTPSPVWDRFANLRKTQSNLPLNEPVKIKVVCGVVVDSFDPALKPYISGPESSALVVQAIREHQSATARSSVSLNFDQVLVRKQSRLRVSKRYLGEWYISVLQPLLPFLPGRRNRQANPPIDSVIDVVASDPTKPLEPRNTVEPPHPAESGLTPKMPVWAAQASEIELSGVVFTAMFNPYDGRKNWADMLTAFCAAFRDTPDATLVFKLGHSEYLSAMHDMLIWMARMPAYKCRVVLIHGYLEGDEFDNLVGASAFAVNASHGEGQCLPLMEFMSSGKPAIAPRHSAMVDYMDEEVGFVVNSWLDGTAWSHDPRLAYRTLRHQIDWASLKDAYSAAYTCAKEQPEKYQQLSRNAVKRMHEHCSQNAAREKLVDFFQLESKVSA
ncbi:glycosyltransferase [Pseudomonas sp. EL_65y_Pfl2_R95]|uniref:glycosyltransferase n=1 Tax=Pseudomonas sp. EL_65y_Pfl2_R95 TaxID=3088698 RepID=UPI0030D97737